MKKKIQSVTILYIIYNITDCIYTLGTQTACWDVLHYNFVRYLAWNILFYTKMAIWYFLLPVYNMARVCQTACWDN